MDVSVKPLPGNHDKVIKIVKPLLLVLLVMLFATGSFWAGMAFTGKKNTSSKTSNTSTTPTPSPSTAPTTTSTPTPTPQKLKDVVQTLPSPTPSPKVTPVVANVYKDWKTYVSPDLKLSLKHKTLTQVSYDAEKGTLTLNKEGATVSLYLYNYEQIWKNNGSLSPMDEGYFDPKMQHEWMAESYTAMKSVKIAGQSYTMRHLFYGDGPLMPSETCDTSTNGYAKLYTEIYKDPKVQDLPIGIDIEYSLLIPVGSCNGREPAAITQQKALLDEALKMVESITYN